MILRYPPLARAAPLVSCVVIVCQALAAGRGASFYGQAVPDLNAITQGGINGPGYDLFEGVHQAYERWANEQQAEDSRESYPALENGTPGDVEDKPLDLDSLTPEEREDLQNMDRGGLHPPESYPDDPNSEQLPDKINTDTGTGAPDSDTGADTPGDNGAGASDTGGNSGAGGGEGGGAGEGGGGGGEGEGGGEGGGGGSD